METPRIKNILDIGKRLTPGTLVHVTASQWKQLTSRIPTGKGVPKYGAVWLWNSILSPTETLLANRCAYRIPARSLE